MKSNTPFKITKDEWEEIKSNHTVRDAFGKKEGETLTAFKRRVYGARYKFNSDRENFIGELFVLHGDSFAYPVVALVRRGGYLQIP